MVQNIVEYNRHCELYKSFKSKDINNMDDIESCTNPSYNNNYHKYANRLNNIINLNGTKDGIEIFPNGDRNE